MYNQLKGMGIALLIVAVNLIGALLLCYPFDGGAPLCKVYIANVEMPVQDMASLGRMIAVGLPSELTVSFKAADGTQIVKRTIPLAEIDGKYLTPSMAEELKPYLDSSVLDTVLGKMKSDQLELEAMLGLSLSKPAPQFHFEAKDLQYNATKLVEYVAAVLRTDFNMTSQSSVDKATAQIIESIAQGNLKGIAVTCTA